MHDLTAAPPLPAPAADLPLNPAAALAAAALLSACGGGGGGGEAGPGAGPAAPPPPPPAPAPPSDAEAARFLAQAGFAATSADIATVKASGYAAWLDAQFAMPVSAGHFDWMVERGYAVEANRNSFAGLDNTLWRKFMSAPDTLRQRVVLALSEIFVVSMSGMPVQWRGLMGAAYVDLLEQHAFGNYRQLLEAVTLSPAMGVYLNMRGNQKADTRTGRVPDENYARECMQLFSIGLVLLNADGSAKLGSDGKAQETYSQAQITELAQILTGWDYDGSSATDPAYVKKPMVNNAARFTPGAKKVLGVDVPSTADGAAALKIVLDTLAAHANVGPFIGRQLIQRLVASHPSAAYVGRVAAVWADNGVGVRGDLKAVVRAVLLDEEARKPSAQPSAGRLREPVQRLVQWARSFGAASPTGLWNVGDTTNPATRLGQSPLRSPSVFNFFRPGYVPPNSTLGTNGITAPEFQLCNESTVAGYLNFMQTVIGSGVGEVRGDYTAELALSTDVPALVDNVALRLAGDAISADTRAKVATAVATITATNDTGKRNRVNAAVLMLMACPEYQVQK
ncbi:DUF1800 domain-containing protein [Roseateles asaccharophilus]|uniref:Uncharacterized protein (DUF1800 family) n=1 Tax=Roseateles asaccharophilus TaxID=582607 RepID=A0ABU2A4R0_9BURK|nr:DUF1800 domain-containing protein [Roseateles asaccharophilus]MDR7332182.1 uncharacterized protein (DUF1800 family) [Roseateles asaccharophilus]